MTIILSWRNRRLPKMRLKFIFRIFWALKMDHCSQTLAPPRATKMTYKIHLYKNLEVQLVTNYTIVYLCLRGLAANI